MTALRDMHRQTRERYIANNRIIERYVRHCVFLRDLSFNRAQPMLRCRIVRSVDDASGPVLGRAGAGRAGGVESAP
ncbi:hypothetical protein QDR71_18105, partial [Xanthomonas perforans]|uniref:hypothetical protein n=1 Tax=Xanthomonas perforans TaxID=442694 RepID=UPI00287C5572